MDQFKDNFRLMSYNLTKDIENDSAIEYIKAKMAKWTYADILLYGQKILANYISRDNLDLTNVPQSKEFIVTIDNTFNSNHNYDYLAVYTRYRFGWPNKDDRYVP